MPRASSVKTTRAARRMLYCVVGAALLSIPTLAVADETFSLQTAVTIPGHPLSSFDISWVDSSLHSYLLADRTNASIDIIDTGAGHTVRQITPSGSNAFAGDTGNSDTSGPNGVLTVSQPGNPNNQNSHGAVQIWAGDGPHGTDCATNVADCSTVKILSFDTGAVVNVVNTGGQARADELCFDPRDHLVMIANDADNPPFVTFISTEGNNKILGKIQIPESNGGVEQCQWNPRNGMIYLNIPSTVDDSNGKVYVIDPRHETIVHKYDAGNGCQPAGMAIGPAPNILLGCGPNAANVAEVMDENTGAVTTIAGQSGSDEVWFNPGDGHYFLAESNNAVQRQLGIVDSGDLSVDQDIKTGPSSHSVAADPNANTAYVPIKCSGGTSGTPTACVAAGVNTTCGSGGGSNAQGCVAIYGPVGTDDSPNVNRDTN
jgi:hypothetical protein